MVRLDNLLKSMVLGIVLLGFFAIITPVKAVDLKIGAVNAVKVLDEAPQKEAALERLQKEFESRNRELVAKQKELRNMEKQFNRDAAIMSEADRKELERDIMNQNRELKREQEVFREDYNIRRNEELRKLQEEIAKAIVNLAERENYDLVVYEGVIYASDKVDITTDVLNMLKSQYKP